MRYLLFLMACGSQCQGAELALEAGRALIHGETSSIALSANFGYQYDVGHDHQNFNYECGIFLNGRNVRNAANLGTQCLVVDSFSHVDLGFGAAYLDHVDQWNGSRLNFALLGRWKFTERWALEWNHVSNANMRMPNYGRDMLRVRYTF